MFGLYALGIVAVLFLAWAFMVTVTLIVAWGMAAFDKILRGIR